MTLSMLTDPLMKTLRSIQYLRAIAALLVAMVHLSAPLQRLGYAGPFPDIFASGVDIFFIISGFVMWVSTAGRDASPLDFLMRRVIRIVPMYWLVTALITAVMLIAPSVVNNGRFELGHVIASFLFIPVEHPTLGHLYPVFVPGWTINYEIFFYVIFAVALLVGPWLRLLGVAALFAALIAIGIAFGGLSGAAEFYTRGNIAEFVGGMALGWAFLSSLKLSRGLALTAIAVGVVTLLCGHLWYMADELDRAIAYGLPALLIVGGAVFYEKQQEVYASGPLGFFGDASYSIYLMHTIPLSAVSFVWARLPLHGLVSWATYVPVALAAVLVFGSLTYVAVERPMTRALLKRYRDSQGKRAPAAA